MTKKKDETLHCDCGNKFTIPVYSTTFVTIDPELKEKVFSGGINSGICNNCGREHRIDQPFLYHDMEVYVWVLPESWKDKEEAEAIRKKYVEEIEVFFRNAVEQLPVLKLIFKKAPYSEAVFGIKELKEKLERRQLGE